MTRLEDIAFAATSVQEFVCMWVVDFFAEAIDIDLDGVGERIE
jgi:hypothetical protein